MRSLTDPGGRERYFKDTPTSPRRIMIYRSSRRVCALADLQRGTRVRVHVPVSSVSGLKVRGPELAHCDRLCLPLR